KSLNLQKERGTTVEGGDLGDFLDKAWNQLGQFVSNKEAFKRFLDKVVPQTHSTIRNGDHAWKLFGLLGDEDFLPPVGTIEGAIVHKPDVPTEYLAMRDRDPRNVPVYLT